MSMEHSSGNPNRKTGPSNLDRFPGPEDWNALQGGKPRVFRNPHRPQARWIVVHVYDEHPDPKHRFASGNIVETLAHQTSNIGDYLIRRKDFEGNEIERDISVPTFMYRRVHGDRCNERSAEASGGQYDRIGSQDAYEAYIRSLDEGGYQELEFKVSKDGKFIMQPLPEIRPPRPLAEPTDPLKLV